MSEQLKYIVQELNKPAFNKNMNVINFDNIEPLQLLQVLTDVLAVIDPKQKIDIREETPDQTAIRIFSILRLLKYKPTDTNENALNAFRQGVVQGDKHIIYPILEWLLRRIPELQKRAHLAQYLMKIDIPLEYLSDTMISDLYLQYDRHIAEFKDIHKELDTLKSSAFDVNEIKKDILLMEDERDQLNKRIEKLKRKVQEGTNSDMMLALAKNYRLAKEQAEELRKQKQDQADVLKQIEQRSRRMQQQIKDLKQNNAGTSPEILFEKLEEEVKINEYMIKDKLPKELELKNKVLNNVVMVLNEPAIGQMELNRIIDQIRTVTADLNQLTEKRMLNKEGIEDKTAVFRNQAAIISRKKETSAEKLFTFREEYTRAESVASEKRAKLQAVNGGQEILKGEEFKRYVNRLQSKKTEYKTKNLELTQLKAECGVLARTEELLKQRLQKSHNDLSNIEAEKGIIGFHDTQEELEFSSERKAQTDDANAFVLDKMSKTVQILNRRLSEKRTSLAPVIKDIRPLREEAQSLQDEYDAKKILHDALIAGLESNRAKQEQEWRTLRDEVLAEESRYHYINSVKLLLAVQEEKITDEVKLYTSAITTATASSESDLKKKSFRDQYSKKIQEQDSLGKTLYDKQKQYRENQMTNSKQMKMWQDIVRFIECKLRMLEKNRNHHHSSAMHVHPSGVGASNTVSLLSTYQASSNVVIRNQNTASNVGVRNQNSSHVTASNVGVRNQNSSHVTASNVGVRNQNSSHVADKPQNNLNIRPMSRNNSKMLQEHPQEN